ncbi:MAG: proline dehydrogenase family protein, partial [Longimicrobiales bacterium]
LLRSALLRASRSEWLGERLPRWRFARHAVRRFMPGETLEDALGAARGLEADGVGTVLTELGENVATAADAAGVERAYHVAFDGIARARLGAELSVKPTHLGLDLGRDVALGHLRALAERSASLGRTLWIDMEGSAYTDATLALYRALRAYTPSVGVCVQANLRRTAADLDALLPLAPAIRLVKGAYLEPPALAFQRKAEVDLAYLTLAGRLLGRGAARVALATHDARMIDALQRDVANADGRAEFQMLYGIGRESQRSLAAAGVPLRVLISYGVAWYPWYVRRLAERPANVWFLVRALAGR